MTRRITIYAFFFIAAILASDALVVLTSFNNAVICQLEADQSEKENEDSSEDDVKMMFVEVNHPISIGPHTASWNGHRVWMNPDIEEKNPPPERVL